jgi:transposase-like protein
MKMATVEVKCPTCGKTEVYKYGKGANGTQRYLCHATDCPRKTFRVEYQYEGAKPGTNEKIIAMAANASGIRDTARVLGISTDKVMDTLKKRES